MELKKLSKKAKTMWYIRNIIVLVVVSCVTFVAMLLTDFSTVSLIAGGASWLILALLLLIWPPLSYKNYSYGYDDKRFYIAQGVIFKHEITAPLCQIQDLHFFEGPIMRLFKVGQVDFATGGSNFSLTGLDNTVAHELIEEIEGMLRARIEVNANEEV